MSDPADELWDAISRAPSLGLDARALILAAAAKSDDEEDGGGGGDGGGEPQRVAEAPLPPEEPPPGPDPKAAGEEAKGALSLGRRDG